MTDWKDTVKYDKTWFLLLPHFCSSCVAARQKKKKKGKVRDNTQKTNELPVTQLEVIRSLLLDICDQEQV